LAAGAPGGLFFRTAKTIGNGLRAVRRHGHRRRLPSRDVVVEDGKIQLVFSYVIFYKRKITFRLNNIRT